MIAANHPLIRVVAAGNFCDDIVNSLQVPVRLHHQVNLRGTGPNAIGERERPAPGVRRDLPANRRKQGLCVGVGDRQHGNRSDSLGFFQREALGIFRCSDSGRQGIAGILRVHHTAALHTFLGAIRPLREVLALGIAVILGIGIDDAADRAVLGSDLRLDAAPRSAITGYHDGTLHGNSQPIKLFVVFPHAVIHVHQRRSHIAIDGIGVVGRQLLRGLLAGGIDAQRWFLQLGDKVRGLKELNMPFLGSGKKNVEGFDVCVETKFLKLRQQPIRIVFVVGRTDVMRMRAQALHFVAQHIRIGNTAELRLPFTLRGGMSGRVAVHSIGRIRRASELDERKHQNSTSRSAGHFIDSSACCVVRSLSEGS